MDDKLIHKTTEGRYREREDWWHLVTDPDTGARTVRHTWKHMNIEKLYLTESEGDESVSVLDFLTTCVDSTIMKSLQKLMDETGRN